MIKGTRQAGRKVIAWSAHHRRDYSFRHTKDPFKLLVAEMLLRQTTAQQVDCVLDILFHEYPTPSSMARADLRHLRALIRPLGIIGRAEQLRSVARMIVRRHFGRVPDDYDALISLPGVGPYIAGTVESFVFGKSYAMIDTNVGRVIGRVFGISFSQKKESYHRIFRAYDGMCPEGKERDFHYGLIDISAMYCRPSKPRCSECPLKAHCVSCAEAKLCRTQAQ